MAFTSMSRIKQLFVREVPGSFYFKLYDLGVSGANCDALEDTQEAVVPMDTPLAILNIQNKLVSKLNKDIFQPQSCQRVIPLRTMSQTLATVRWSRSRS